MNNPIIKLTDLTYSIDGRDILKDVNLEIYEGEIFTIVGLSGAGKSTILRLLSGLIFPTSGKIEVLGVEISNKMTQENYQELLSKVGFVFQYGALFDSLTVLENVGFTLYEHSKLSDKEIRIKVADALASVGMSGTEKLYPAELSGGMQKRIGIARSLVLNPRILFYDEPNSGLDPIISATIDDLILTLRDKKGVTAILVTHDIKSVKTISSRVAFLYEGKLSFVGTIEEAVASDNDEFKQFLAGNTSGPIKVI